MNYETLLGAEVASLLGDFTPRIPKASLTLPAHDTVDRLLRDTDRPVSCLRNLQWLHTSGRLANTGHLSILPVDHGADGFAVSTFGANPGYFDPLRLVELAIEAGCNGISSTLGALGMASRRYAHRIPFIVKLNHQERLTYPNTADHTMLGSVCQAADLGAVSIAATIFFGSDESRRQIVEVSQAFDEAHRLGLFTVLHTYLANPAFEHDGVDDRFSADLSAQANHLGVTIEADIIKQKLPTHSGGLQALGYTKDKPSDLVGAHPIDLVRWQVVNCYAGRIGMITSGGASGDNDLASVVRAAIINKRAGGTGVIAGRKAFQRPTAEGIALLQAIQDVYLDESVSVV